MKVILLGATPPPVGGIAQWTVRMLNSQLKNGWEIDFIDEKILGGRECFGSNVRKNYFYELKRWWRIWSTLRKKVKNPEAKVVHACPIASKSSMLAEYVSATITKRYKKRFVIHFRCTVPNMIKSSLDRFLLRLFCNKSDQIIALNSQTKKYLETITDTPVVVIPNFVEVSEINEQKRIADEVKTVLYVGGVIKEKGCEDILEVAKNFPEIEDRKSVV